MDPLGNQRDYYQVLGVSRDATLLEIEAAMERKQQEYDPEKLEGLGERLLQLAQRETDLIRTAYEVLKASDMIDNLITKISVPIDLPRKIRCRIKQCVKEPK